jgi:hypothetical protein
MCELAPDPSHQHFNTERIQMTKNSFANKKHKSFAPLMLAPSHKINVINHIAKCTGMDTETDLILSEPCPLVTRKSSMQTIDDLRNYLIEYRTFEFGTKLQSEFQFTKQKQKIQEDYKKQNPPVTKAAVPKQIIYSNGNANIHPPMLGQRPVVQLQAHVPGTMQGRTMLPVKKPSKQQIICNIQIVNSFIFLFIDLFSVLN